MTTYSTRQWARALAAVFGAGFIVCFAWGSLISDPALAALHIDILKMSHFGFTGMNGASFVSGLIQSVIGGFVAGWAVATSLNYFAKK